MKLTDFRVFRVAIAPIALVAAYGAFAADTYAIDPVHSSATFKIRHLTVSVLSGRFNDLSGTVVLDAADESKNTVEVEIKTASVDTGNKTRDTHLKTKDFFDVEKFPVMSFKSKSFKKKDDTKYEVTGDFTLHGVTKSITIEVEKTGAGKDPKGKEIVGFETEFKILRSEYGMTTDGPPMIGDEVKIAFAAECDKKS